jgi:hypothetical protein
MFTEQRQTTAAAYAQLELAACPQCGEAAELIEYGTVGSGDGPIEHWFLMPRERL